MINFFKWLFPSIPLPPTFSEGFWENYQAACERDRILKREKRHAMARRIRRKKRDV